MKSKRKIKKKIIKDEVFILRRGWDKKVQDK